MSTSFAIVDFEHLTFPNHLRVDYVRVYQDPNNINIGCDPEDFPTADYINTWGLLPFIVSGVFEPAFTTERRDEHYVMTSGAVTSALSLSLSL